MVMTTIQRELSTARNLVLERSVVKGIDSKTVTRLLPVAVKKGAHVCTLDNTLSWQVCPT